MFLRLVAVVAFASIFGASPSHSAPTKLTASDNGVADGMLVVAQHLEALSTRLEVSAPGEDVAHELGRVSATKRLIRHIADGINAITQNQSINISSEIRQSLTGIARKLLITTNGQQYATRQDMGRALKQIARDTNVRFGNEKLPRSKPSRFGGLFSGSAKAEFATQYDIALGAIGQSVTSSIIGLKVPRSRALDHDAEAKRFAESVRGDIFERPEFNSRRFWDGVEAVVEVYFEAGHHSRLEIAKRYQDKAHADMLSNDMLRYREAFADKASTQTISPTEVGEIEIEVELDKLSIIEKLQLLDSASPICERMLRTKRRSAK